MSYKIAIIEDDQNIAKGISKLLDNYSYTTVVLKNFDSLDQEIKLINPHLILLDINLPYFNGFYWAQKIRNFTKCPIIIISARDGSMDQVMAIESGADDYITKPFDNDIVLAKIKSQIRRNYGDYSNDENKLEINGLTLQIDKLILCYHNKEVILSAKEMILLHYLMSKHDKVVNREVLLEKVWDNQDFVDGNTLNVNINRIRKKLEDLGLIDSLSTIRGLGYKLSIKK